MGETETPTKDELQPDDAHDPGVKPPLRLRAFGGISSLVLRLLGATWRVDVLGRDPRMGPAAADGPDRPPGQAQLAALFHESMLPCAWHYRDQRYTVAISRSRDGDLIAATLSALGYADAPRGSSSRGGSAVLRGLLRQLETGTTTAVLVDGPRGPARQSKPGILSLARLSGLPIQPVAFAARPALRLSSWDRSLVPLPFARVICAYGEPIPIDPELVTDEAEEQARAEELDRALTALTRRAEAALED